MGKAPVLAGIKELLVELLQPGSLSLTIERILNY